MNFRLSKKKKILISSISILLVFILSIGTILKNVFLSGETNAAGLPSTGNIAEVFFLNTQNDISIPSAAQQQNGAAVIMRTYDEKYLLFDTAQFNSTKDPNRKVKEIIYNALKKMQGNPEKVTIDYLVISHLHGDHMGNATSIIEDNNIVVKNVVVKFEKANESKHKNYAKIIAEATSRANTNSNKIEHIYTNVSATTDGALLTALKKEDGDIYGARNYALFNNLKANLGEGDSLPLGNYVDLYFYNTSDVFAGKNCDKKYGYIYGWTSAIDKSIKYVTAHNDKKNYMYFDGSNYKNTIPAIGIGTNITTTELKKIFNKDDRMKSRFYAYVYQDYHETGISPCESNANSYAILAKVKNNSSSNKFVLLTGDLENNGYRINAKNGYFGNGLSAIDEELGEMNDNQAYFVPSETNVAKKIKEVWGSGKNITILQIPHHGNNAAPDAINTLGLNRSDLYAVANNARDLGGYKVFSKTRTYYFALSNLPAKQKLFTGEKDNGGVLCAITQSGKTNCSGTIKYTSYVSKTLTLNYNGQTSAYPTKATCGISSFAEGKTCRVAIPTIADKSGAKLLGWADSATATTAKYTAGNTFDFTSSTANKTIYAVWATARALSFNSNGGSGAIANQTCYPTTAGASATCSVTIPSSKPTRSGYIFLGWADSAAATSPNPSYNTGASVTLSASKTIYAVWGKTINITTSVNGIGGIVSDSYTNVLTGETRTITFTPDEDYEIDNVTINGVVASDIVNNTLTVTAGTEDLNIVVTYRFTGESDPIEPGTEVTFNLSFNANNGSNAPNKISCTTTESSCLVEIPDTIPTRSNYYFLGWATTASALSPSTFDNNTVTLTRNTTIYAIWAPIYTLTYDSDGGTEVTGEACHPETRTGSCLINITTTRPTRNDYTFKGWSVVEHSTEADYQPGDPISLSANQIFYAVWVENVTPDPDPGPDDTPDDDEDYDDDDGGDETDPEEDTEDEGEDDPGYNPDEDTSSDDSSQDSSIPVPNTSGKNDGTAPNTGKYTNTEETSGPIITIALPIIIIATIAAFYVKKNSKVHRKFD